MESDSTEPKFLCIISAHQELMHLMLGVQLLCREVILP